MATLLDVFNQAARLVTTVNRDYQDYREKENQLFAEHEYLALQEAQNAVILEAKKNPDWKEEDIKNEFSRTVTDWYDKALKNGDQINGKNSPNYIRKLDTIRARAESGIAVTAKRVESDRYFENLRAAADENVQALINAGDIEGAYYTIDEGAAAGAYTKEEQVNLKQAAGKQFFLLQVDSLPLKYTTVKDAKAHLAGDLTELGNKTKQPITEAAIEELRDETVTKIQTGNYDALYEANWNRYYDARNEGNTGLANTIARQVRSQADRMGDELGSEKKTAIYSQFVQVKEKPKSGKDGEFLDTEIDGLLKKYMPSVLLKYSQTVDDDLSTTGYEDKEGRPLTGFDAAVSDFMVRLQANGIPAFVVIGKDKDGNPEYAMNGEIKGQVIARLQSALDAEYRKASDNNTGNEKPLPGFERVSRIANNILVTNKKTEGIIKKKGDNAERQITEDFAMQKWAIIHKYAGVSGDIEGMKAEWEALNTSYLGKILNDRMTPKGGTNQPGDLTDTAWVKGEVKTSPEGRVSYTGNYGDLVKAAGALAGLPVIRNVTGGVIENRLGNTTTTAVKNDLEKIGMSLLESKGLEGFTRHDRGNIVSFTKGNDTYDVVVDNQNNIALQKRGTKGYFARAYDREKEEKTADMEYDNALKGKLIYGGL